MNPLTGLFYAQRRFYLTGGVYKKFPQYLWPEYTQTQCCKTIQDRRPPGLLEHLTRIIGVQQDIGVHEDLIGHNAQAFPRTRLPC